MRNGPASRALLLVVVACLAGSVFAQTTPEKGDGLGKFAEEFWAWRAATEPFTSDDIPRLERPGGARDWSRAAIENEKRKLAEFEERWKGLAANRRDAARQVDYRLLGSALQRVRWELELYPRWKLDPNFYVDQSLAALVEALVEPPPFDRNRSRELLTRIRNVPKIVQDGEANLANPPAPFVRAAIDSLGGVKEKLLGMTASLAPLTTLSPAELEAALDGAGSALEEYRGWLEKRLPGLPGETKVGRETYLFFLKNVALIPYTPERLLEMSQEEWARAVAFESYEQARDGDAPPLKIAANTAVWISSAAADERAIREFLEARQLLSVPEGIPHYELRPMPEYLRAVADFGETDDFRPSRPGGSSVRYVELPSETLGFFWRATAEDPRPITVHEGVPGHCFQLNLSWRNPDPIRRHYYDSGANEGIGFYAEEMMLEAGLFDDRPRTRGIIYQFMRLRALRVEADVKLALGIFSLEQAAEYLEKRVPMDRKTAQSEAVMFLTTPGQAISYQVGKLQILGFLADARRKEGDKFRLEKFHDFLWMNGNVPIALQRSEYLGE